MVAQHVPGCYRARMATNDDIRLIVREELSALLLSMAGTLAPATCPGTSVADRDADALALAFATLAHGSPMTSAKILASAPALLPLSPTQLGILLSAHRGKVAPDGRVLVRHRSDGGLRLYSLRPAPPTPDAPAPAEPGRQGGR